MNSFKEYIVEASLGRLYNHLNNGEPIAIISACRGWDPELETKEENKQKNNKNTKELRTYVLAAKFGYNKISGVYVENINGKNEKVEEKSTLIYTSPDKEDELKKFVVAMGEKYRQECILFVDTEGKGVLIMTSVPNSFNLPKNAIYVIGKFKPNAIDDMYTKIGKKSFVFTVENTNIETFLDNDYHPSYFQMHGLKHFKKCIQEYSEDDFKKYVENISIFS